MAEYTGSVQSGGGSPLPELPSKKKKAESEMGERDVKKVSTPGLESRDIANIAHVSQHALPGGVSSVVEKPQEHRIRQEVKRTFSESSILSQGKLPGRGEIQSEEGPTSSLEASGDVESEWGCSEKSYLTNLKHKIAEEYLLRNDTDPEMLKDFLLNGVDGKSPYEDFGKRFDEALRNKSVVQFLPLLDHVPEDDLVDIIRTLKLNIPVRQDVSPNTFAFTEKALQDLEAYVLHPKTGFSVVITLQDLKGLHTIASEGVASNAIFAIHSIGKVFTGVLAIRLIQEGLIDEKILTAPLQLDENVVSLLPPKIQEYLKTAKPTLHQLMQHEGGLGDYVENYTKAISEALHSGKEPPKMEKPEDFLRYAEESTDFPKPHYSNVGFLLIGLCLQYHTGVSFDVLLERYVTTPASMRCFCAQMPSGALFNPEDPAAEHLCGSPAGGYWTTAQDLCSFGSWISSQWRKEPRFKELIERYGGEFYSKGEMSHSGGITSASAYLSIFPQQGVVVSILSNKKHPGAKEMNAAIRSHMLHL